MIGATDRSPDATDRSPDEQAELVERLSQLSFDELVEHCNRVLAQHITGRTLTCVG